MGHVSHLCTEVKIKNFFVDKIVTLISGHKIMAKIAGLGTVLVVLFCGCTPFCQPLVAIPPTGLRVDCCM
jgi:hypothetical protein